MQPPTEQPTQPLAAEPELGHGDHRQWEAFWGSDDPASSSVFTRGAARFLRQLWQQCYFADLWAELHGTTSGAHGVELGSGRGTTSMYLADKGWQVTMVDLAPQGFRLASASFQHAGLPPPNFILSDARQTGLADACCDCVYNIGLLEHFDDPRPVLAEALRLLRPGGLLFMVIVPGIPQSRRWLVDLLFSPWRLFPRGMKSAVKKRLGRPTAAAPANLTRTEYPRQRYADWLTELGAVDVRCLAYNAYHDPQLGARFDRLLATPCFRAHRALKSLVARPPLMKTFASLASCDLLMGRKK